MAFSNSGRGNSKKLFLTICYCMITFTISAPCVCPSEPAIWENPCGTDINSWNETDLVSENIDPKMWRKLIFKSLKHVHSELKLSLYFYKSQNFSKLYEQIEGVAELNQFSIPKWLPGKGDVESLSTQLINEIPSMLKMFYSDLQKFAIAFEQMLKDETEDARKKAIDIMNTNLNSLLCEVKSSLVYLQMGVPVTLHRSIMSESERIVTNSFRLIRDCGILKRYGEFIKQWGTLMRNLKRRRRRRHAASSPTPAGSSSTVSTW